MKTNVAGLHAFGISWVADTNLGNDFINVQEEVGTKVHRFENRDKYVDQFIEHELRYERVEKRWKMEVSGQLLDATLNEFKHMSKCLSSRDNGIGAFVNKILSLLMISTTYIINRGIQITESR